MDPLPSFIIAGAQKCGTTSLHRYLAQHRDVYLPAKPQETHFFDLEENYQRGVSWYLDCFRGNQGNRVIGETSPLYMYLEQVPERIHQLLPNVKLIFLLRNPVDRAYSQYWHERKKGREPLSFEDALASEAERIARDFVYKRRYSYLSRGRYLVQIERFVRYFPRSQMLFLIFEGFSEGPGACLERCFEFLEVAQDGGIDCSVRHNPTVTVRSDFLRRLANSRLVSPMPLQRGIRRLESKLNRRVGYAPMSERTRQKLIEHFSDENRSLEAFLGRELDAWHR